jgi:hypothetical protein
MDIGHQLLVLHFKTPVEIMFGLKLTQQNSKSFALELGRHSRYAFGLLVAVIGFVHCSNQARAGCGCPQQDGWYERANSAKDRVLNDRAGRLVQTRVMYVEGKLLFTYTSSAPRCSGPECRQHKPLSNPPLVPVTVSTDLAKLLSGSLMSGIQTVPLIVDSLAIEDDHCVVGFLDGIERPPRLA